MEGLVGKTEAVTDCRDAAQEVRTLTAAVRSLTAELKVMRVEVVNAMRSQASGDQSTQGAVHQPPHSRR